MDSDGVEAVVNPVVEELLSLARALNVGGLDRRLIDANGKGKFGDLQPR